MITKQCFKHVQISKQQGKYQWVDQEIHGIVMSKLYTATEATYILHLTVLLDFHNDKSMMFLDTSIYN